MITLKNLTLGYGNQTILSNVNFAFPDVQTIALMGASGCGKTTLLKALAGLLLPQSGIITGLQNKKIAVLFQEDRLLPWYTALENVALVGSRENAKKWLSALDVLPDKYPFELSGGMARRVALARALNYSGDLLVLDEPFTGLDEGTKGNVIKEILKIGIPIMMSTHDPAEAQALHAQIVSMNDLKSISD